VAGAFDHRLEGSEMKKNMTLWVVQGLLAALFLFAGVMKLVLPIEAMAGPVALPGLFIRFIGVCEALGAIGLIVPGLVRIHTELTPVAAAGLVIIMIGAAVVTVMGGSTAGAVVPVVVGALLVSVTYGRTRAGQAVAA
jgi:DoxX-like protein